MDLLIAILKMVVGGTVGFICFRSLWKTPLRTGRTPWAGSTVLRAASVWGVGPSCAADGQTRIKLPPGRPRPACDRPFGSIGLRGC